MLSFLRLVNLQKNIHISIYDMYIHICIFILLLKKEILILLYFSIKLFIDY